MWISATFIQQDKRDETGLISDALWHVTAAVIPVPPLFLLDVLSKIEEAGDVFENHILCQILFVGAIC